MSLGIRKNDTVEIISGPSRGKKGRVIRVESGRTRACVEGVNVVKQFVRKSRKNQQGGMIQQERPVALSNMALWCPQCGGGVRFSVNILQDRSKVRVCAECDGVLGEVK